MDSETHHKWWATRRMTLLRVLALTTLVFCGCLYNTEVSPQKGAVVEELAKLSPDQLRQKAIEVADGEMTLFLKKREQDLSLYDRKIVEDSLSFKIYYQTNVPGMLGGGAMFQVSKKDLSVIGGELYQ